MQQWGDLLLRLSGKRRGQGRDSLLVRSLGFWNCYGSYYADLFRPTGATTLRALSASFRETGVPVRISDWTSGITMTRWALPVATSPMRRSIPRA